MTCFVFLLILTTFAAGAEEPWVTIGPGHKLVYRPTPRGDRILDFSVAGYMGGGVRLPNAPVGVTLSPGSLPDDTARIRQALDRLADKASASHPLALLLQPGEYRCAGPVTLNHDGVVLRGSGSGPSGTVIKLTGTAHQAFVMGGSRTADDTEEAKEDTGSLIGEPAPITGGYIPAGARTITVRNPGNLKVGDEVIINRPVTPRWVEFMGMDKLVRNGKPQTWIKAGEHSAIGTERRITALDGPRVTLDLPLTDNFESAYLNPPGPILQVILPPHRLRQTGIEHLTVMAAAPAALVFGQPQFRGVVLQDVEDSWVQDVRFVNTEGSIRAMHSTRRLTFKKCAIVHEVDPPRRGAKFGDIGGDGSQLLFYQIETTGNYRFPYTCGGRVTGPNAVVDFKLNGQSTIQPHMRWATGLLLDNCRAPDGGISLINRGTAGSGHGWTIGWSVVWNCQAKSFEVQQPPGAVNWSIGSGTELTARPVQPASLYKAQLAERLGPAAVANLDAD